ncbi:MAG: hypothetical protein BGO31_15995 [Bacteroidetes bacterium 43-16]|nr:MAG: hypothetical protein BGO31_15995 [Bacteroidetes bacterium 43-16]
MRGFYLIFTLVLLCHTEVFSQAKDLSKEYNYKMPGANIPPFEVKTLKGALVSNKDVAAYDKVMLILFNPSCGHCQDLAKDIVKEYKGLENVAIIYIGGKGVDEHIPRFIEETGLDKILDQKNVYIGTDNTKKSDTQYEISEFLYNLFEFRLPQVNIYDQKRTMIYKSLGTADINAILEKVNTK